MKIVHCIFSFCYGGAETMLCDIITEQSAAHEVSLVVVNDVYDPTLLARLPQNVNVVLLRRRPSGRNPWFVMKLNHILHRIKPDIVHIHSCDLLSLIFGLRKKLWYTAHSVGIPIKHTGRLHGVFAISEAVKKDIVGKCRCEVHVVPNGIAVDTIARKENYACGKVFRIIQVARLAHEIKGQDLLIRALSRLKTEDINDVHVDFVGTGPSETYLKELAAELNVDDMVSFSGLRDRDYVYARLKDYDLMCHPARNEGFGLVVAEAMAAGLPVLVSDNGGPFEVIAGGRYGFSFRSDDDEDLARKIIEIKRDYSGHTDMFDRAYTHVAENYSVSRMVNDYLLAYNAK